MKAMNNTDKVLAWIGLAFGGGLSVAGNLRAAQLPAIPTGNEADLNAWRAMETVEPGMTSLVAAVAVPFAAVLLVEMLNRWTFLPNVVRRGAIGTVAFIAAAASWVHLFTVMLHEGNHPMIAATVPLIPDTIAIVSAMALLSSVRTTDTGTVDSGQPDASDNGQADTVDSGQPDASDMDTAPDTIAELDSLDMDTAPADIIPGQRRPRADAGWKARAREIIAENPALSHREVAEKIIAEGQWTWTGKDPVEAGRKAVSRLS